MTDYADSVQSWAAAPVGLALGAYGLTRMLGLPSGALRMGMAAALPAGIYQYMKYNSPENMLQDISSVNRRFYDKLNDPNERLFVSPEHAEMARSAEQQKIMKQYQDPGRTAMSYAIPAFGVGMALPSALSLVSRLAAR